MLREILKLPIFKFWKKLPYSRIMETKKILVPAKHIQGMKELNRSAFDTKVTVPYVQISSQNIGKMNKLLKPYMLKLDNMKPVESAEDSNYKVILLNPEKVTNLSDIKTEAHIKLEDYGINEAALNFKEIIIGYNNWKAETILRAVIPEDLPTIGGYSIIGHILHLNLRDHHQPYKKVIGEVFSEKMPRIRTVVNKTNIIDSTYRNFQMELLAGDDDFEVTVKEHGVQFMFDFSKVYWNPRLSTEHTRVVEKLRDGDILFDVFSGVGPFSIPAAKKKCKVYANDLNPESFKWLCHNAKLNKVDRMIETFNLDGRDFITTVVKEKMKELIESDKNNTNVHVAMNLPAIGVEFLSSFIGLLPDVSTDNLNLVVHSYCFIKDLTHSEQAKELVEEKLGCELSKEDLREIIHVRNVAPNKEMFRVSFKMPISVLRYRCEPPEKKLKLSK